MYTHAHPYAGIYDIHTGPLAPSHAWSAADDATLTTGWLGGKPAIEIGHRLDRTLGEIARRVIDLGLPARNHRLQVLPHAAPAPVPELPPAA